MLAHKWCLHMGGITTRVVSAHAWDHQMGGICTRMVSAHGWDHPMGGITMWVVSAQVWDHHTGGVCRWMAPAQRWDSPRRWRLHVDSVCRRVGSSRGWDHHVDGVCTRAGRIWTQAAAGTGHAWTQVGPIHERHAEALRWHLDHGWNVCGQVTLQQGAAVQERYWYETHACTGVACLHMGTCRQGPCLHPRGGDPRWADGAMAHLGPGRLLQVQAACAGTGVGSARGGAAAHRAARRGPGPSA